MRVGMAGVGTGRAAVDLAVAERAAVDLDVAERAGGGRTRRQLGGSVGWPRTGAQRRT